MPASIDRKLEEMIGEPVLDIAVGVPVDLPPPAGWPYGLRFVRLASVGVDPYPDGFLRSRPTPRARRARALGIKVLALRRGTSRFEIDGVERASDLQDLASRSDRSRVTPVDGRKR